MVRRIYEVDPLTCRECGSEMKIVSFILDSPIIKKIAKQRGFTMVLEKNESAVLWADKALDITAEVNKLVK